MPGIAAGTSKTDFLPLQKNDVNVTASSSAVVRPEYPAPTMQISALMRPERGFVSGAEAAVAYQSVTSKGEKEAINPHSQFRSLRASSASRSPSPMKLKLVTASVMATPGTMASQGALSRYCWAPFNMLPQLGSGG